MEHDFLMINIIVQKLSYWKDVSYDLTCGVGSQYIKCLGMHLKNKFKDDVLYRHIKK